MTSVLLAVMLGGGSALSSAPGKSWSAPFHGRFHHYDSTSSYGCAATQANTTVAVPSSNLTTGITHLGVQTTANASACPAFSAHGAARSIVEFTTPKFSLLSRVHHFAITWRLRWFAQVLSSGPRVKAGGPASASYTVGLAGAGICARPSTVTTCTVFPNSSAPWSNASVGWYNRTTVTNGTSGHVGSATVTVYFNGAFGGAVKYWIFTSIFVSVETHARRGTAHAHAIVLMSPILGGYAKLVGITIS